MEYNAEKILMKFKVNFEAGFSTCISIESKV